MPKQPDARLFGSLLMLGGVLTIPLIDLAGKGLGQGYFGPETGEWIWVIGEPMPALQIGWTRFFFQTVLLAPVALIALSAAQRRPKRLGLILLRAALMACATVSFFAALQFLGMAEAISIFFVEPLLLTLLSAAVLQERIGWRRLTAIGLGMAGALLIIRPNFAEVGPAALLPVVTACCFAAYLLLTRILAQNESTLMLQVWSGVGGALLLGALLSVGHIAGIDQMAPIAPNERQWLVMLGLGLVAASAHFVITAAFRYAEASVLAPLQYFEILGAALCGYFAFGERLDAITLIGLSLIVGSGLFVLQRERELKVGAAAPLSSDRRGEDG